MGLIRRGTGRHRARRHPVRDLLHGLYLWVLVRDPVTAWGRARVASRVYRATPAQIASVGTSMRALPAWTRERIPLQVSYEEHARGVRLIEEYTT
jgi:hypothetical protein